MQHRRDNAGFLLIEVLVALAILSIALAAVSYAISQSIDTTAALRDRAIAMWVAQDRIALHRMRREWPATKTTSGTRELAGRTWNWEEKIATTPVAQLRRIEVEVLSDDKSDVLARLVGFVRDQRASP
ncbi:MAG: type II secretion system minor pseudopilin GspI [Acidiferrobacterales bacterium]